MTAVAAPAAVPATSTVLLRLARIEALRYARHPLFVVGLLLALASSGTYGPVELDHQVVPAFFIGVLGLVVASRLATATDTSRPVVMAAPVIEPVRTAALCLACAVPALAGLLVVVVHRLFVLADPPRSYEYAGYGATDRWWITIVIPVVACAGGPLLGVLVGRWLRFRGATVLAVLLVLLWSQIGAYYPAQRLDAESLFARTLHLFTPYTAFLETNAGGNAGADAGDVVHRLGVLVPGLDVGAVRDGCDRRDRARRHRPAPRGRGAVVRRCGGPRGGRAGRSGSAPEPTTSSTTPRTGTPAW